MAKLSISKAWDEASAFLRREARLVVPVALAMFTVPATLFGWYNPSGDPNQATGGLGWPLTLILLVLAIAGQMTIAGMAIGWSGSIGSALAHALRRVWGVLGSVLIVFFPLSVVLVLVIAVMVGNSGITDPTQITAESLAAVPGLSFVLLIMTLIFLFIATRLFQISAIGMVETANPVRILARSWQLTGGHFLRLVGTLLLILIASFVASIAVTVVVGSAMTLAAGEPQPYNLSALIVSLADGVVSAAISAISAALVGRIYVQLSAGQATVPEVSRDNG
jgi:magnesium-transporting ATPase (P-type)